ncbi:MAG TPA: ABC transporter permease [Terrimesophilobacter sp.]|nr:ABC transporter permease [Terrimesophilobacter sp.]
MTPSAQERADRLAQEPFQVSGRVRASFLRNLVAPAREIFSHRELLGLLVRRELKSRYKDSSLGFLWSLIKPLTMLLIYYVAIGQFLGAARGVPDFAIFVFAGLTLWGLYSEIVAIGTKSIVINAPLIRKVYLPREIFPLAATGSALFNFAIQMVVLIGAIVALGQFPVSWRVVYALAAIVIVLIYGVALAILLSALNVYLRDVEYLVEVGLLVFFWASPIVYSWSYVVDAAVRSELPWLEWVYLLNPISNAMLAFQVGLWKAGSEDRVLGDITILAQQWPADLDLRLLIVTVVGLLLLWVSQRVFSRLQGNFAQEI